MSDAATRSQVRGSTLLLTGQAFALALSLATQVILVRHLTKESFGAFAYALSIVALAETVAAFGLRRGVSRFVPVYEERGDVARAAGTLVFALVTVMTLGLAVVLVVLGLRNAIAGGVASGGEAATLLGILILLAPIQAIENLLDGSFAVFARPRAIAARKHVFAPGMRFVVVVLLALSDQDSRFVAWGYVLAGALGVAIYGAMLGRVLRGRGLLAPIRERRLAVPVREVLGFTVPLLSTDVAAALLNSAATVLLGVLATVGDVASFRAVLPISLTMAYVLSSFGLLFVPLSARLHERGDAAGVNRLYWQTAAWTAVLSLPIFLLAFAYAEPLTVLLFGERYAGAGEVLAALVVGHFVTAALGPNGVLLGIYGAIRFVVWTNVASVVVNVCLCLALISAWGALGAAVAASATQVVLNGGRQIGLARRTDVHAFDRDYAGIYGAALAAVAVVAGVQAAVDLPLGAGAVLVAAASGAVLLVARRRLAFAETFPELARLPGVGRLLGEAPAP